MGNSNPHECSLENPSEKGVVALPTHQVLAQIAPEREEQLKQITQVTSADCLRALPGLAVDDRSTQVEATTAAPAHGKQLEAGKHDEESFERFYASLSTPGARVGETVERDRTDATAGGDKQEAKADKLELAAGIRIEVINEPATSSGLSLDDVLTQAVLSREETAFHIPGRTDTELALNGLLQANLPLGELEAPTVAPVSFETPPVVPANLDRTPATSASLEAPLAANIEAAVAAAVTAAENVVLPGALQADGTRTDGQLAANIPGAALTTGLETTNEHDPHIRKKHFHDRHADSTNHSSLRHAHHIYGDGFDLLLYAGATPTVDTLMVNVRSMVFSPGTEKRFMTGAEIALGVVLVAGAISRSKENESDEDVHRRVKRRRNDPDSVNYFQKLTGASTKRATWIVGAGDTLTVLAERFYEDAQVGYLIAQINQGLTAQHQIDGKLVVQLFTRQTIYLPNKEDLAQFYASNREQLRPENLITIISEREFDRQLVHMVMNRAMGVATEAVPAPKPAYAAASVAAGATAEIPDDERHPPLPPPGSGAIALSGFLSYLRAKYQPQQSAAAIARAQLSLRCKFSA